MLGWWITCIVPTYLDFVGRGRHVLQLPLHWLRSFPSHFALLCFALLSCLHCPAFVFALPCFRVCFTLLSCLLCFQVALLRFALLCFACSASCLLSSPCVCFFDYSKHAPARTHARTSLRVLYCNKAKKGTLPFLYRLSRPASAPEGPKLGNHPSWRAVPSVLFHHIIDGRTRLR